MKRIILVSIITCLAISSLQAIYYRIPYFARPAALGEATVSVLGDATGIFTNPASINNKIVSFSLTEWLLDTRAGSCVGSYNVMDYFMIGGGVTYFSYGPMRYFDDEGNPGDYFSADIWQYRISLAKQLYNRISLGIGTKILQQNIETVKETKFLADFGAIYYSKLFDVGASVHDPTDVSFDVGISAKPVKDLLLLVAMNYQDKAVMRAGIEYNFKPVSFRIGFNNKRLAGGIGYQQQGFSFDYALTDYGQVGLTHQFSITLK